MGYWRARYHVRDYSSSVDDKEIWIGNFNKNKEHMRME